MEKQIVKNERLNEQYIRVKHPSGLTIVLCPMEGYSSAYALFGTRYGSVDTTFKTTKEKDFVTVPEGIAHFLEHKLFENDDCDTFELFAKTGANCNAYTSFDKTAYLFSCSTKFEENLEILLKFVQEPYFTAETVQKEQGIIGQEIRMYDDSPSWRVMFNCLTALYQNNPVKVDIAGTTESIAQITDKLLYRCYNTFYNLHNMVLSIAGNFDAETALKICDKMLKNNENIELETQTPDEPYEVTQHEIVQKMSCSIPLFYIGFKKPVYSGIDGIREYILQNILLELCFGDGSEFYKNAYDDGIINDESGCGVFDGRGFFVPMLWGESRNSREVFARAKAELYRLRKDGLSEKQFEIIRKKTYGELVRAFNSVESVSSNLLNAEMSGITPYDSIEVVANASLADITKRLDELDIENSCLSIVEPADR